MAQAKTAYPGKNKAADKAKKPAAKKAATTKPAAKKAATTKKPQTKKAAPKEAEKRGPGAPVLIQDKVRKTIDFTGDTHDYIVKHSGGKEFSPFVRELVEKWKEEHIAANKKK